MPGETTQLTVLVFTDICDSTALKAEHGALEYKRAAQLHNALFERLASEEKLTVIKNTGDGYLARTSSHASAVWFALRFQHEMRTMHWPSFPLTTRFGIHAGEVADITTLGQPDLLGPAVDLVARVMSLAVGGQILVTRGPYTEAQNFIRKHPDTEDGKVPNLAWLAHGWYGFKGAADPLEIFELGAEGLAPLITPPDGEKAWRVGPRDSEKERAADADSTNASLQRRTRFGTRITIASLAVVIILAGVIFFLTKKPARIEAGPIAATERIERDKLVERALSTYQSRFRELREQHKELPNKTIDETVRAWLRAALKIDGPTVKDILDTDAPKLATAVDTPLEKKLSALFVMGNYENVIKEGEKKVSQLAMASLRTMGDAVRAQFENVPDKNHLEIAIRYYNGAAVMHKDTAPTKWADIQAGAADVLYILARHKEAEPLLREVAAICKEHCGENSARYATALNSLARSLQATNRMEEAEPLYRRALKINEPILGSLHPGTLLIRKNLESLQKKVER